MEVVLSYSAPEGSEEIVLEGDKLSFGRGSEADHRFPDDGLSRLHSTIYRDGGNVWVVDENSTNGTFVNGEKVPSSGTPLQDGDTIKIGNYTTLKVRFVEKQTAPISSSGHQTKSATVSASTESPRNLSTLIPIIAISAAIFIISISAVFIAIKVLNKDDSVIVKSNNVDVTPDDDSIENTDDNSVTKTPTPTVTPQSGNPTETTPANSGSSTTPTTSPEVGPSPTPNIKLPGGKKYLEMSETERRNYIAVKAQKVASLIGNRSSEEIPSLAIDRIKGFLDAYAKRANIGKLAGCKFGDNLQATYERASKNAPFIIRAFIQEGIDPQIGMYLAMIESEHCVCLQSPTGPLGMFQFTKATGETYGLKTISGASPANPDERCEPEPAARAAAKYMKFLAGRYGTGPSSFPLAIGSYNSGEGGLSKNLMIALESDKGLPRDFWSLVANGEKLSKQFQSENFKYVPKFFAAAIVGENPSDFGLNLEPLSTYIK
jgi:hypothetical protein